MKTFLVKSFSDLTPVFKFLLSKEKKNFFLNGDLGVGKTTFVSEFLKYRYGLTDKDLNETGVMSPTFSLINLYEIKKNIILHCDFYRADPRDSIGEEILEEIESSDYGFVEWKLKIDYKILEDHFGFVDINIALKEDGIRQVDVLI